MSPEMQKNILYLNDDWWEMLEFDHMVFGDMDFVRLTKINQREEQFEVYYNEGGVTGIRVQQDTFGSTGAKSEQINLEPGDELVEVTYELVQFADTPISVVKFPEFKTKNKLNYGPYPKHAPVNFDVLKTATLNSGWKDRLLFATKCKKQFYG